MTDVLVEATRLWHLAPGAVQEAALSALVDAQLIRAQLEIPVGLYEPMDYLKGHYIEWRIASLWWL